MKLLYLTKHIIIALLIAIGLFGHSAQSRPPKPGTSKPGAKNNITPNNITPPKRKQPEPLPEEILQLTQEDFLIPPQSVFQLSQYQSKKRTMTYPSEIWYKLQIENSNINEIKLVYSSTPDSYIQRLISDSLQKTTLRIPTENEKDLWYYHRVAVYGSHDSTFINPAEFPEPNDFGAIDCAQKTHIPEMIYQVTPDYPELAKNTGIDGTVWLQVLVMKDGTVRDAKLGKSSGYVSLDEAALKAAYKCRYTPAMECGSLVNIWITYKYVFELGDK